uniref:Uncharacterized protein n=1 Tax=Anopheles farauti TaxID=69004 RepID=A0A182QNQ1_9DIPT
MAVVAEVAATAVDTADDVAKLDGRCGAVKEAFRGIPIASPPPIVGDMASVGDGVDDSEDVEQQDEAEDAADSGDGEDGGDILLQLEQLTHEVEVGRDDGTGELHQLVCFQQRKTLVAHHVRDRDRGTAADAGLTVEQHSRTLFPGFL